MKELKKIPQIVSLKIFFILLLRLMFATFASDDKKRKTINLFVSLNFTMSSSFFACKISRDLTCNYYTWTERAMRRGIFLINITIDFNGTAESIFA